VADTIAARGMNLPSGADLTPNEVAYVVEQLAQLAR
jgi:dTDP-4-amino-4,6-dideoxygalactose transaminase